jgi:hypothetical protein
MMPLAWTRTEGWGEAVVLRKCAAEQCHSEDVRT